MNFGCSILTCLFAIAISPQSPATAQSTPPQESLEVSQVFGTDNEWCECSRCCDPIETDRHDFTQSVSVVGKGASQLEFGYLFLYSDSPEGVEKTHAAPEIALRYGLTENIEFKIRWNYVWRFTDSSEEGDDKDSAEDLRIMFKFALTEQCRWIPESAIQLRSTVPTGGSAWTTRDAEPGINLIYAWEIFEDWSLAGSTGVGSNGGGDVSLYDAELGQTDDFVAWHQSVALGIPINERSEIYLEYYGIWSYGLEDEFVQNYFNIGVDYLLSCDLVIDFRIGTGLSDDAEDFFCGIGGGYRF